MLPRGHRLYFLHFPEILVLVGFCSVLSAGLADNQSHSWTLRPVTSSSFHPTPQHTSHPTTPYHLTTTPNHLSLKTSHPTQQWTYVAKKSHGPQTRGRQTSTHSGATEGGGKKDHTRSGATRRDGGQPCHRVNEGGRRPRQVHIFEFCRLLFSLRVWLSRFTLSMKEFENPTSAPLIAPVDTITPVPLPYRVRTFYIVRYNSPTTQASQPTQPSQPTYSTNELPKEDKKKVTKNT